MPVCQSSGACFLLFPLNYLERLHVLCAEKSVARSNFEQQCGGGGGGGRKLKDLMSARRKRLNS